MGIAKQKASRPCDKSATMPFVADVGWQKFMLLEVLWLTVFE
jgi:hypothetical protein